LACRSETVIRGKAAGRIEAWHFLAAEIIEWADGRDRPLRLRADEGRLFVRCAMAVKLNRKGFAFGKELVNEGRSVRDERDVRSVERGSTIRRAGE